MKPTSITAGRAAAIGVTALLSCLVLAACGGSSHSVALLSADAHHVVCVTPADHHVLVAKRANGTPAPLVPDRRTGREIACEVSHTPPPKAVGSAPDVAACLPQVSIEHPEESVCLFWYNETTLNLSLQTASCGDGHISPGTYDSYPGESYSALPSNTFLTQDFDPSEGKGGNTRVQCEVVWNDQGGGPALKASFNYDEFSSPTKLSVTATASPNYSIPLSAFVAPVNNNMASVVLCDQSDPLCSGHYKCPEGDDWMSCEFGSNPATDEKASPILSAVSMPGAHDAGTFSLLPEPVLEPCASGGNEWEDLASPVVEDWAKTQVGDTFEQASAGARYFDVRGIDAEIEIAGKTLLAGVRHCHTLPAATWSDIFGVRLDTPLDEPASGLVQFGEKHPGEVMMVDFTHMYNPAKPGTAEFNAVASDLKQLCKYAIPPEEFSAPGSTPINELRQYAIKNNRYFLFYMTTSDSGGGGTDPFEAYDKAVPNCLFSESTKAGSGTGIINESYDEHESADPLDDYVSPLTDPATAFANFQGAQYNLAQHEYENIPPSGNKSPWVTQYIWAPTDLRARTITYFASDTLKDWTELGLVHTYAYDNSPLPYSLEPAAYPAAGQFVTGLDRAALARGVAASGEIQPQNIVLMDDIANGFWTWGPSEHTINALPLIWNQNYSELVSVTVKITTSGSASGTVSDQDGLLKCSSSSTGGCSATLPVGDLLTGYPSSGSQMSTFDGSACSQTEERCTISGAGTVNAEFTGFALSPPRNLSLTPENAAASALWQAPDWEGAGAITAYTATAYQQGDSKHEHPISQCTTQPEKEAGSYLFCEITGLVNGDTYWVIVQAKNSAGETSNSTSSPLVTPSTAPAAGGSTPAGSHHS